MIRNLTFTLFSILSTTFDHFLLFYSNFCLTFILLFNFASTFASSSFCHAISDKLIIFTLLFELGFRTNYAKMFKFSLS